MAETHYTSLSPQERAAEELRVRQVAEGELARAYARAFATKEGQVVLADLRSLFSHERTRFDAMTTRGNPLAALIGGIHYDGSAQVMAHILGKVQAGGGGGSAAASGNGRGVESVPQVVGP